MDRRTKILANLEIKSLSGVEIGPLAWPLVRKSDGDITYVDFADAETLRKNYASNGHVPLQEIVEVDAIWGANTLSAAIGEHRKVDYVVASHVIEHVPDILTWIDEIKSVLKPGGEIRLAIPDRRFTFDYLRRETQLSEVLAAHAIRPRKPQPQQILEFVLNYVDVDRMAAWKGELYHLKPNGSIQDALHLIRQSQRGEYIDVHCWVFTPKSLSTLFSCLAKAGLFDLECVYFEDTEYGEYEFFVGLRACSDGEQVVRSWDAMAASTTELPDPAVIAEERQAAIAALTSDMEQLSETLRATESERDAAANEVAALRASRSWTITRPLRILSSWVRG